jgi:tripeptide aminopeptidase
MEFNEKIPEDEAPEFTEGREGFFHLLSIQGDVEQTKLQYILRDHDRDKFEAKKALFEEITKEIQSEYGEKSIELDMHDQYYNMREKIEPVMEIVDIASDAMKRLDITPLIKPIRGATDGSQISYKGLPTPNVFTGGENYHGKFEYISVDNMEKATTVIIEIAKLFEEQAN